MKCEPQVRVLVGLIFNLALVAEAKFYSAAIARDRLVTDLFVNYDPNSRPTHSDERIEVYVDIVLQHFDFCESDGSFKFVGLLEAYWHDPKLGWNPKDYNNLTRIPVSQKVVWVPDLEVYNNAPDKFIRMHRYGIVILENTGFVQWSDAIEVTMFCTTNMINWPHDQHICKMRLGSWTYDGHEMDIVNSKPNNTMNFDDIDMQNMEYKVVNFSAEHVTTMYQCCSEPYITIDYNIIFERRSSFVLIFRAPALCVIFLTLLSLSMEPWCGEKIWLNGISIIIITFQMIYFASRVGNFARETPLIVSFYSGAFVLVTLAHMICVYSLLATRTRYRGRLPTFVSSFLRSRFVHYIAPMSVNNSKHDHAELNSNFEDVKLEEEFSNLLGGADCYARDWNRLAKVIERVSLFVFAILFLILGSVCYV